MAKSPYNWKRFWCRPEGRVNRSDSGFLVDPDAEYGRALNPDVVSWDDISTTACLILLGEPGIGKSTALKDEHDRSAAFGASTGDQVVWVDLRSYQTDQRLHEDVFASPTIKSWMEGSHRLHLFIDSMDEALMRIDNIGPVLLNELKKLPISRLNVRLACRTADWPRSLESQLADLWREDNVGIFELAQLRRTDVQIAARENELEPDAFVSEVLRSNAVPLAIKPVTLAFLLNTFKRSGTFPSTQVELYNQGCRLLCEDPRQQLRPKKPASESTAGQRLAVASRIALATILCNRNAVWTDIDRGDVPAEDIPIHDLLGGKADWQTEEIQVGEDAIWQSLNTGLFSSRGSSRLGWAHQTYAEFLAARFLASGPLAPERILSLILHEDGKVIPQLHELAAWIASMTPDLFRRLMKTDAEFLLRSDAATVDSRDRQDLVQNLLSLFDQGELLDFDWDQRRRYRKLNHPRLADQLRPYITDKTKGIVVRRVAITIAEACDVQTLQNELVHVSLDSSDAQEVRGAAAFAILRIGSAVAKEAMRPLALGTAGPDPDDDLKGCGLACTWPAYLTVDELLGVLTPEKNPNRIGLYSSFLRQPIADHISRADLPSALSWSAERSGQPDPLNPLTTIADAIAAKALELTNDPAVLQSLARVVHTWTTLSAFGINGRELSQFRAKLAENEERRRSLLAAVLPLVANRPFEFLHLFGGSLVVSHDFNWLLQRIQVASPIEEHAIAELISRLYDHRDPSQTDALLEACRHNTTVANQFSWLVNPITLGSPEAKAIKARWDQMNLPTFRSRQRSLLDPSPQQRISALLEKFESGDLDAFWQLNLDLTLNPDSTHYGSEWEAELAVLPGWKDAAVLTRERIIDAAKHYLETYDPRSRGTSIKTDTLTRPALAGYRALRLLVKIQSEFVENLPQICWQRWAFMTLVFPLLGDAARGTDERRLVELAYSHAPTEVIAVLDELIDKENEQHGVLFVLQRVETIWDDKLAIALLGKLRDPALKPGVWGTILSELLAHNVAEARNIAKDCLEPVTASAGAERTRGIQAAQALFSHASDAGWDIVWPAVQKDSSFGVDVFSGIAHIMEAFSATSVTKLTDHQLAELYIWLVEHVPYSEDHTAKGFGAVSPAQSLGHWRDAVLSHLKNRGSDESCDGIARAMARFPDLKWLKWHLREAEQIARRHAWTPLSPKELLALTADSDCRLIQHGSQLLEVLVESLERLEAELQGETPGAPDLWNETAKTCYSPKDEMRLSDYVKRHFERDIRDRGIVVNREVQIRQAMGNKPGENTDIHVDAVTERAGGKHDSVSAIVETKGCWNKELTTAMQIQLRDRYLKDNACPFGLYLIGWFMCNQWDAHDYRRGDTPKLTLNEARENFRSQAATLSSSDGEFPVSMPDCG